MNYPYLMVIAKLKDDESKITVFPYVYDIGHYYEHTIEGSRQCLRLLSKLNQERGPERDYIDLEKYNVEIVWNKNDEKKKPLRSIPKYERESHHVDMIDRKKGKADGKSKEPII